jgi:hypothetical protein
LENAVYNSNSKQEGQVLFSKKIIFLTHTSQTPEKSSFYKNTPPPYYTFFQTLCVTLLTCFFSSLLSPLKTKKQGSFCARKSFHFLNVLTLFVRFNFLLML